MKLAAVIPAFIGLVVFWWLFHGIGMHWDAATQSDVMAAGDTPLVAAAIGGIAGLPFFLLARRFYRTGGGNFHADVRSIICVLLYISGFAIVGNVLFALRYDTWQVVPMAILISVILFLPFWFVARSIWRARGTYL